MAITSRRIVDDLKKFNERNAPLEIFYVSIILVACYAVHWFPFDFLAAFKRLPQEWTMAIVAVLLGGRIAIAKYLPDVFRVLTAVYYTFVTLYTLALCFFMSILDPLFLGPVLIFAGTVAYAFIKVPEKRWPMWVFAGLLLVYILPFPFWVFVVLGIFIFILLMPGFLFYPPQKFGRLPLAFAMILSLLILRFGYFYIGKDTAEIPRVISQPGIEVVFTSADRNNTAWRSVGLQIRFVADNMAQTRTLVGSDSGLFSVKYNGTYDSGRIFSGTSGDGVAYDPVGSQIITGDYYGERLIVLRDKSLREISTASAPGHAFTNVWMDETKRQVLTGDDFSREIGVFDVARNAFVNFLPAEASRDAIRDPVSGLYIATSLRRVRWIDPNTGETVRSLKVPSIQIRLAIDAKRRLLYVSSFSSGEIWRVNLDTGEIEKKQRLGRGIRFIKLTPDTNRLFVADYFHGMIYELAAPELLPLRKIFAGQRVRTLHIAPGSQKLVFGSSLGAYRYNFGGLPTK